MATLDVIVQENIRLVYNARFELMNQNGFDYTFTLSIDITDKSRDYSKDETSKIKLIVNELMANALKAIYGVSEPRNAPNHEELKEISGKIEFKVYEQGGNYVLSCKDDGSGIPDEIKPKIFVDRFSTRGTSGVGLLLMKKYVESLAGRVYFETEVNKGTTFYVELPK
ncbi:TPA: sensor histidine kinase [Candidatus Woesearchaeota archaeon]|nr:sensor histidine kinase [Candidatus Woesearchaeota archaeon]